MSTVLSFSKANPVRIVRKEFSGRNANNPDDRLFHEYAKPYSRNFAQPWEQTDTIDVIWNSSFDVNILELVKYGTGEVVIADSFEDPTEYEDGTLVSYEDGENVEFEGAANRASSVINDMTTYKVIHTRFPLSLPEGIYQIRGKGYMNDGSGSYRVESEILEVRPEIRNSVLFRYYNNEVAFGIDSRGSAVTFQFRLKADFTKPADSNEYENIVSANSNQSKLRDVTLEKRMLEFFEPVPSWVIQKVNLILAHDYVTIDDVEVKGADKIEHSYDGWGHHFAQPSVVIPLRSSDLDNRGDSGVRILFS